MSTHSPLLSVDGLTKSYGGVPAVRGVSFALASGEILALIGPKGAGKSTCVKTVSALCRHDTGAKPESIRSPHKRFSVGYE